VFVWFAIATEAVLIITGSLVIAAVLILFFSLLSAAASTVFRAVLFSYATGKELPGEVESAELSQAFLPAND